MSRPSSTAHSHTHTHPINPTVPPAIHHLASPLPVLIDNNLPNYLLPQVIASLQASATHVVRKRIAQEDQLRQEGFLPSSGGGSVSGVNGKGKGRVQGQGQGQEDERQVEEKIQEAGRERLESMGSMVGGYIAEKLTITRAPLSNHLDIIKFICKDLFLYVYSKQIDNLRTNHRGTFVLQSHAFPPIVGASSHRGTAADLEAVKMHLIFPQALIQGALARLGMPAYVSAECTILPQCTFQIRTVKSTQGTPGLSTPAPLPVTMVGHQQQQQQQQQHSQAPSQTAPPPPPTKDAVNPTGKSDMGTRTARPESIVAGLSGLGLAG